MTLPAPVLVGFLPKATQPKPNWLKVETVQEICSVSECISPAPEKRIDHWLHNTWGFYDTEALARAVMGEAAQRYELYAYELFPFASLAEQVTAFSLVADLGAVPADYACLGFDIVTCSMAAATNGVLPEWVFFECSPLSCNHAAADFATNAHCLIETAEAAYRALLALSGPEAKAEPGPYYLFKVYRKQNGHLPKTDGTAI